MTADFSLRFINSVINMFRKGKDHGVESFMIPPDLFGITKTFISTEIPYCGLNEIKSTHLLKKFHKFINDGFTVGITCETRNLRSLFPLKDYKSSIIYKGDCYCSWQYIGETKRIIDHCFTWTIISNALKNAKKRKSLEASCTDLWKPNLNEQKDFERLALFRNGVT